MTAEDPAENALHAVVAMLENEHAVAATEPAPTDTAEEIFHQITGSIRAMTDQGGHPMEEWAAHYEAEAAMWMRIWDLSCNDRSPRWSTYAAGVAADKCREEAASFRRRIAAQAIMHADRVIGE